MNRKQTALAGLLICVLVAGLFSAGCDGAVNQKNYEKIQKGMTSQEVLKILGEPTRSHGVDIAVFSGTVSEWKGSDGTISVQFVNGKVFSKQFIKSAK